MLQVTQIVDLVSLESKILLLNTTPQGDACNCIQFVLRKLTITVCIVIIVQQECLEVCISKYHSRLCAILCYRQCYTLNSLTRQDDRCSTRFSCIIFSYNKHQLTSRHSTCCLCQSNPIFLDCSGNLDICLQINH